MVRDQLDAAIERPAGRRVIGRNGIGLAESLDIELCRRPAQTLKEGCYPVSPVQRKLLVAAWVQVRRVVGKAVDLHYEVRVGIQKGGVIGQDRLRCRVRRGHAVSE